MSERVEFRMPEQETRKLFKGLLVRALLPLPLLFVMDLHKNLNLLLFVVVVCIGFFCYVYFSNKNKVHLALSADGIEGFGRTGQRVRIGWQESVTVQAEQAPRFKVLVIAREGSGTAADRATHAIGVPEPVYNQNGVAQAIERFAPADHPLRSFRSMSEPHV
ncbi:MAG: hypothetical protein Q4A28_08105 [Brachymonas sp.]|nr:hypothetical protein [Brachymonas sp.]